MNSQPLKKAPFILNAMATKRGYGAKFHIYFQALSQARDSFGQGWEQILGLVEVVQFFNGTGDPLTAEIITKLVGTKTITTVTANQNPGNSSMGNTFGLAGRSMLMPDEVMRYSLPNQLCIYIGAGPVEGILIDPSLWEFRDYRYFADGIEEGYSPKSLISGLEAIERARQRASKPSPPAPKPVRKLLGFELPAALSDLSLPRISLPDFAPGRWFDAIIRIIMGHESK